MEILKKGTPPEDMVYTGTCPNCTTQIRFKRSEASLLSTHQLDPAELGIACPVCPAQIRVYVDPRHS